MIPDRKTKKLLAQTGILCRATKANVQNLTRIVSDTSLVGRENSICTDLKFFSFETQTKTQQRANQLLYKGSPTVHVSISCIFIGDNEKAKPSCKFLVNRLNKIRSGACLAVKSLEDKMTETVIVRLLFRRVENGRHGKVGQT